MNPTVILSAGLPVIIILSFVSVLLYLRMRRFRARYAPIIDLEAELSKVKRELEQATTQKQTILSENELKRTQLKQQYEEAKARYEDSTKKGLEAASLQKQAFLSENERQRAQLKQEYDQARARYEELKKELSLLEENLEDISFGVYKPHFNFQTSELYKKQLELVRDRQKTLIRGEKAAICLTTWTVGGSKKEGERMAKQNIKLVLRAFNGECDATVARVSWNNITKMEERLRKSLEAVNKLSAVLQVSITNEYLQLKLDELRLAFEYDEKRYQEQEEQRRIREQMKDDEKAQREIEKAREEAEQEEARYEKALEKARAEAEKATGDKLQELNDKIKSLAAQVEEAHQQKERAISRAQLTKSGHVYVLSNIGSFGEQVYKVGMTRRLEPMDRVKELGDASVPFPFDVHAMIYSENAPALENSIHTYMNERRVNLVNLRKEFFQVTLDDIEKFVSEKGFKIEFAKIAEAKEYRETVSMRIKIKPTPVPGAEQFPPALFANTDTSGATPKS